MRTGYGVAVALLALGLGAIGCATEEIGDRRTTTTPPPTTVSIAPTLTTAASPTYTGLIPNTATPVSRPTSTISTVGPPSTLSPTLSAPVLTSPLGPTGMQVEPTPSAAPSSR
ncbi:hypothetical protein [Nocardia lijiangensis]|uniref:hypothetical protein n=1 Tax=Nocardia lijiangensis TaxID=299618 RepID=UPI003D70B473